MVCGVFVNGVQCDKPHMLADEGWSSAGVSHRSLQLYNIRLQMCLEWTSAVQVFVCGIEPPHVWSVRPRHAALVGPPSTECSFLNRVVTSNTTLQGIWSHCCIFTIIVEVQKINLSFLTWTIRLICGCEKVWAIWGKYDVVFVLFIDLLDVGKSPV